MELSIDIRYHSAEYSKYTLMTFIPDAGLEVSNLLSNFASKLLRKS